MNKHFTHTHLHTEYSLLDGAISIERLIDFGKKHDFKSLAITDHGNIFGAVKFFQKCKKAGIKPVLGMEAYFTDDASIKNVDNKYYHLVLLVQNRIGYRNLCKLIAYSYQEGFYFKPRIDYKMLAKHSEGLIVTSACLGGHIPKLLMNNQAAEAHKKIDWFLDVFGPERFYLEVQPEDQAEQKILNQHLYTLSAERSIQLVAAGDCHYVGADDREAHEVMLSINTHDKLDNPDRYTFGDCRVHIRTQDEMLALFKEHEDAVWNTGKITDMCDFTFETGKLFFPMFQVPEQSTPESHFKDLCIRGLERLISAGQINSAERKTYDDRLTIEMDLIISMGFVGYFLVVSDFMQWAYHNNVPTGPGRGSAAGSLVAWALQITNIDPIKYNLLFERFLNPERVSMPDIDIDFCIDGRERVINYVRDKYGKDKVCHIITFGTMMAKGVIKDVARVLGFSFEDSNAITNLIPEQLKITLTEALEQEPRLKEMIESNPRVKRLFDIAFKLEGLTRHASKHAAGIVISPEPIEEVLPIYVPPKTDELVAQYAMTELESIGFLKIDFLGLKNLTIIDQTIKTIAHTHGITLDINKLPLDDAKTFALICAGTTSAVFQLESSGLKDVLRKLQPDKFEDIIAVNALYRPGPLGSGMVDDYIERRHGRQKITYLFDELEPILQETYGVIVYQEQVMKIASTIGGYSLGEADILRRAMGKKKADEMDKQRTIFLERTDARGLNNKKAGELFDLMAYFAGYGFNKSHSAAYALIAYQTAYLKANYPAEFMASVISLEAHHAEKMSFYLQEAREMGITILPPDINRSQIDFSVVDGAILFGLRGIKNVGHAALENIVQQRSKKPFAGLFDLCKRVDLRTANKRVLQNLICAGTFDALPGSRAQQFEEIGDIIEQAVAWKRDAATGQMGLFKVAAVAEHSSADEYAFKSTASWSDRERLEKECEVVGFYISDHPLSTYQSQLKQFGCASFDTMLSHAQQDKQQEYVGITAGLVKSRKNIVTKKGDRMAFLQLEDTSSSAEVVVFPKLYAQIEQWLESHQLFVVKGSVDASSSTSLKIKANAMVPLELVLQEWPQIQQVAIELPPFFDEQMIQNLKQKLSKGTIPLTIMFEENSTQLCINTKERVALDSTIIADVEKLNTRVTVTL